jgi:hypothetical protein
MQTTNVQFSMVNAHFEESTTGNHHHNSGNENHFAKHSHILFANRYQLTRQSITVRWIEAGENLLSTPLQSVVGSRAQ